MNMQNFKEFSLDEAHKIGSSVEVIKGSGKGIKGHIGEIRHGAFKGAPKTYTVYHGEHDAIQVPKEHIRAIKEDNDLDEGYGEGDIATGGTVIYKHEGKHVMSKMSHKTGGGAGTKIHTIAKHVVPLHHIVSTDASDWNHYKLKEDADLDEARMTAAQRLSNAWDKQRAKSDASLRRTPSSIPKKEEPKKQGVAEASDRMQRYGQLILKRKAEQNAAAQAAKPQPKKEEPPASSDYDSMSTRDFMKQLRDQRRPKKKGVAEAFRPMDEPRYDLSIEARQKRADNAAKAKKEEPKKEVSEALDTHEIAMSHKDKASKALETSDMKSFHNHMSNHHESMGQWHESKGRHSAADREYAKGEEHHEKSLKPDNSRTVGAKNESAICIHCQSDPCICDDSHGFVSEAAQGHTIEAHGIRGMKGTAWRKTFKNHEHLSDWADKNDSVEVHATRDLEQAKKGNLSPAMKEEALSEGANQHKVSVTVSEKDHPMVSKRLEKQQKRVIVSADSKEEAVVRAKKFYTKQGYHVHDAEYHSPQAKTSMKTESVVPSFNEFVSEMWHAGDAYKREFKRREMEHELGHEDRAEKESGNSSHAVHINGKKWKSFSTKSHAQNVAHKIKGATVQKEEYVDENASLDKYKI